MSLSMQISQTQSLELKLELKQVMQQKIHSEILLQLKQQLPEFEDIITFEDDDDWELLQKSFPFLMLHELSHPLQTKGFLKVAELYIPQDLGEALCQCDDYDVKSLQHNANEVGIDKGAVLLGSVKCHYNLDNMAESSTGMAQRVYNAMFIDERIPRVNDLIARLHAQMNFFQAQDITSYNKEAAEELTGRFLSKINKKIDMDAYVGLVKAYEEVYVQTMLMHEVEK